MKEFHSIKTTVFIKENEDKEKIIKGLRNFFPFEIEKEKIKIKQEKAKGFEDRSILITSIKIEKPKHIKQFINKLFDNLKKIQKEQILEEIETRTDENGNFYLRFEKETWAKEKILFLTDEGNCYHLRFKAAVYPCTKEKTIEKIRKIFSDEIKNV